MSFAPCKILPCLLLVALFLLAAGSQAIAADYVPAGDLAGPGSTYTATKGETLYGIARKFDVGANEMIAANAGINPWKVKAGTALSIPDIHILPAQREGIVIDLARLRLFLFLDRHIVTFPISVGKTGWATPLGSTKVVLKRKDPVWRPPPDIRLEDPTLPELVPAGPGNPLGAFALNLGWPGYAIHGTNNPNSIGKRVSHGCIRLYPEDIAHLFQLTAADTPVTVVNEPLHIGWRGQSLYLEVSPSMHRVLLSDISAQVTAFAGPRAQIDWQVVGKALQRKSGLPVEVGHGKGGMFSLGFFETHH